jgi:hypothetical protein
MATVLSGQLELFLGILPSSDDVQEHTVEIWRILVFFPQDMAIFVRIFSPQKTICWISQPLHGLVEN